ncbi:hypothetical protein FI667_g13402, partial [Globisporangium splendens]
MESNKYSQVAEAFIPDRVDIDYVEITGPPSCLEVISRAEFTVGTFKRDLSKRSGQYLLLAYQPGYVYVKVTEEQRMDIVFDLSVRFGVILDPSPDPTVLLKSVSRRVVSSQLVDMLEGMEVAEVIYVNYGMKSPIRFYSWLSLLPQECRVIVDVGVEDLSKDVDLVILTRFTGGPMVDHIYHNFELFSVVQCGVGPAFGTCLIEAKRNVATNMLKARVYSSIVHSLKANVQAAWVPKPRTVKALRRYEEYYKRLPVAYLRDGDRCCLIRTEIRLRMRSWETLLEDFGRFRREVYARTEFRRLKFDEILYSMPQILDWAKSKNIFQGTDSRGCTPQQVRLYHVVNNSHGYAGKGSQSAIDQSRALIADAYAYYQQKRIADGRVFGIASGVEENEAIDLISDSEEEEKMDVDAGHVQFADEVEVIDLIDREEAVYDDDEDLVSEEESDRRQRQTSVSLRDLMSDVETNLLIVREGRTKWYQVKKLNGNLWKRGTSREYLIQRVVDELKGDWRQHVMSK